MKLQFHTEAAEELQRAVEYYEQQAQRLGLDLLAEVERALSLLDQHPESGVAWRHQTRRLPLRRFPFNLIYQIRNDELLILAVAHQRRKPRYWTSRS